MAEFDDYIRVEKLISKFFETVDYCRNSCPDLQTQQDRLIGCCNCGLPVYDPEEEKKVRAGLYGPYIRSDDECGYHSDTGCRLKTLKPVGCLSFACNPFHEYLIQQYGINFRTYSSSNKLYDLDSPTTEIHYLLSKILANKATPKEIKGLERKINMFISIVEKKKPAAFIHSSFQRRP